MGMIRRAQVEGDVTEEFARPFIRGLAQIMSDNANRGETKRSAGLTELRIRQVAS